MTPLTLHQPRRILFGAGCLSQLSDHCLEQGVHRLLILTIPAARAAISELCASLQKAGVETSVYETISREPTVGDFEQLFAAVAPFGADGVLAVGGGSVMDVGKLLAVFLRSGQTLDECFYQDRPIGGRTLWLACAPTTSGTGSEVSPNAILLNEREEIKKGLVSPYLMPDAAYLDATLTLSVPARVTAETGMDALTHCIEAYTNRFAHPMIDLYALEGIRLIARHLLRAVEEGNDLEAREALMLGSYYGGICLGPVNTAAVHALSYPLGGEYHLSHGLANALLLPAVMRFNLPSQTGKFARIALACGKEAKAEAAVEYVTQLSKACGIPDKLTQAGIPAEAAPHLAEAAMKVTRLLKNNPRELTRADAQTIYESLL
ncbi:MAG: iron-containing alcohol dehydrogenase [Prevotellaceae bacterium]|jgi:alcohol dehydrogenase class IV|nr:iron-containing alcohol dehydrogenase [Prevotellaceae bacterium]